MRAAVEVEARAVVGGDARVTMGDAGIPYVLGIEGRRTSAGRQLQLQLRRVITRELVRPAVFGK